VWRKFDHAAGLEKCSDPFVFANFLVGAGFSGALCDGICLGFNHSFGGDTAIEVGGGIKIPAKGPNGSTGFMVPLFPLPFTQGDAKPSSQNGSDK
jgi:hypothetical protein